MSSDKPMPKEGVTMMRRRVSILIFILCSGCSGVLERCKERTLEQTINTLTETLPRLHSEEHPPKGSYPADSLTHKIEKVTLNGCSLKMTEASKTTFSEPDAFWMAYESTYSIQLSNLSRPVTVERKTGKARDHLLISIRTAPGKEIRYQFTTSGDDLEVGVERKSTQVIELLANPDLRPLAERAAKSLSHAIELCGGK
jgi:hypothetical protein